MNAQRLCPLLLVVALALLVGCDSSTSGKSQPKKSGSKIASKLASDPKQTTTKVARKESTAEPKKQPEPVKEDPVESEFDFSFNNSSTPFQGGSAFSGGGGQNESREGFSSAKIIERVTSLLQDSIDYRPTLAVWLIDESKSARPLVMNVSNSLRQPYAGLKQADDEQRFLTAVCTFGQQIRFPVDSPSNDPAALTKAMDSLQQDTTGKEMLFTAVGETLSKYAGYRTEQKREVMFFVVTDEAGDDQAAAERLIGDVGKYGIPVYVIGVPAPLGRVAAIDASVEVADSATAIQQGPESRYSEHIELGFWGGATDFRLMDSGFGPFALERLCRASNGRYIALRPPTSGYSFTSATNTEWPNAGVWQPEPNAMRKYAPDYVSEADYQALLQANPACMALHNAAKLPPIEFTQLPTMSFVKQNEAQLATEVAKAQQFAAKHGPPIEHLYTTLERGEAGRAKLSPRWKATYDLAFGRAAAAHARIEGYNEMLAALKRGKSFEDESHNTWELQTAETTEVNSKLRKLCARAREYLESVVKEHPGTPWAKLAARELETPLGWKWAER